MILDDGVITENQDIELSLYRKGTNGIDESEMPAAFEAGLFPHNREANIGNTQISLGLERACVAAAVSFSDTTHVILGECSSPLYYSCNCRLSKNV